MMASPETLPQDHHTTCPIHQMTFGEVVRYLQNGYETPVQRALLSHVKYCNVCAAEVERVRALCQAGQHVMTEHLEDFYLEPASALDEAQLAAYIDGVLSEKEAKVVARQIAESHACYQQFSAVERDLGTPVAAHYRAPAEALNAVRLELPQALPQLQEQLRRHWAHLRDRLAPLFAAPWRAPALALVLGALALLVIWPRMQGPTVIPLAGPTGTATAEEVLSGQVPGVQAEGDILFISPDAGEKLTFSWLPPEERPVDHYHIGVYDAENRMITEVNTATTEWTTGTALFADTTPYTVLVMAVYDDGGRRPVSRQKVQRSR